MMFYSQFQTDFLAEFHCVTSITSYMHNCRQVVCASKITERNNFKLECI